MKCNFLIGIDPGVHTGLAVWNCERQEFESISTMSIVAAMNTIVEAMVRKGHKIKLTFEDARLRTYFGNKGREVLQGAGSIKRDSRIWQEFCEFHEIDYVKVSPQNALTKVAPDYFKRLTGWDKRTSEHSRDAAMLIWQGNNK